MGRDRELGTEDPCCPHSARTQHSPYLGWDFLSYQDSDHFSQGPFGSSVMWVHNSKGHILLPPPW